ncbi:hypothetical protein, partial [Paraburkholderia sp. RL17-373-BIF-A]|uniref:hypothetical protein n=1 Tax=Paraburkholderia sp. RL17-373-BIF-A TaxID=3031629 RepID=UPI0038B9325A
VGRPNRKTAIKQRRFKPPIAQASSSDGKIGQTVVDQTRRNQRTIAVRPTDWDSTSGFHQGQAGMRLTLKSGCMAAIYAFKPS